MSYNSNSVLLPFHTDVSICILIGDLESSQLGWSLDKGVELYEYH